MNKAYRVIWSGVRNCYVVTSELAKKHKKSTANGMLNAVVSAGLIIAAGGQVLAAPSELVPGEGPGIAVGNESKAKSENAIALGNKSSAEDENVIAMGPGAVARAKGSLAIGLEAETGKATLSGQSAEDSIAIGTRATTFGMESIAIGKESHSDGQAVVIGSEAKSNTTDPKGAVVIGYKSSTKDGNTVTIGKEAKTENSNGIAIGTQSLVRGHGGLAIGGTGSNLRPIDAPHVSDILPGAVALGQTSMALGPQAMSSGESSIALGFVSHAAGENALAIGELTYAGTLAHAAGYKARAIGTATQAQGMYSVATGAGGLAFGPYAVSVGSPSFKQGKPTSDAGYGIAIGGESFSSGYSAALGFKAQANGRGSLALGVGATVELEDIQAITDKNVEGYLAGNQDIKDLIESRYASELKKFQADDRHKNKALAGFVREYLYAQKAETMGAMKGTAIGYNTTVSVPTGVALGANSIGNRAGFTAKTIAPFSEVDLNGKTLGAVSVGQKDGLRQIINLADGTEDTDAVNIRQLKGLEEKIKEEMPTGNSSVTKAGDYVTVMEETKDKVTTYTVSGPKLISPDATIKITDLQDDKGNKTGYQLSVDSTKLNIRADTHVKEGAYQVGEITLADGKKTTGVTMEIVDHDGKDTGKSVIISDVASKTYVDNEITNINTKIDGAKVHFFSVKGNSSDENYNNDGATGERALAVGVAAKAGGLNATALTGGNASGAFSFAVGNNAQAKGWGSVAIGAGTLAEKQGTVAIGHGAKAYSLESVALGYNTRAGAPSGEPGAGNSAQTAMGSGTIATGGAATAFGLGSVASGAHAIAGGDNAKATGQDSVALGYNTKASGTWSVALGRDTKAKGGHSTALGYNTEAEGEWSTALGYDTKASGSASTAMGSTTQATGTGSTAMGGSTTAAGNWSLASGGWSNAKGDYSTAMGYYSMANAWNSFAVSGGIVEAAAENSIAMGKGAKASVSDAVALGSGSVASTEKGKIGYDISGADHSNDTTGVWKSTENAVSVGDASKGITRQITGVAAGTQDTDAVNVAQLKAVKAAADAAKVHYYSAKSKKTGAGSNYDNDGAKVDDSIVLGISSSSDGVNSTVLGNNNKLTGDKNGRNNSIVVGQNLDVEGVHNAVFGTDYNNYDHKETKVFGEQNTVIGVGNLVGYTAKKDPSDPTKWIYTKKSSGSDQNVAVGMTNTVNGASVVVGADSEAEELGASFGRGNKIIGSNNGGGYRGLALGTNLTVKGEEAVAVGTNASATADWAIAMGTESSAEKETAMAFGYASHAKVARGVALGSWSVADRAGGVSGYDPSTKAASTDTSATWKSTVGAVSVGDASKGITRQITGVAAGREDTDAVNVAQLKKVEAKAAEVEKKHTTVKAGDYATVTESTNGDGGKEYTISGPKMESTDGTVKITDKVENGKKVGYNLSVDTSSLGIEKTEVTAGENVTVTSQKDGNKTTYTINAKDTVVTGGTASYATDGKGTATLTNNDGSKAEITGLRDLYTSSASLDGNTLNFTRNDGSTYSVSGIASSQDIKNVTNKVGELGTRVNRVGAGAAALAALHPLDFDPDDKWDVAAGYGNYKDAHAVAVGAFYRPNEDTMLSVGGSFGGGENMVNAGVSVKVGQGNNVSTSKVAMAREIKELRAIVEKQNGQIQKLEELVLGHSTSGLQENTRGEFPDLPKNHWAYEYVRALADRGLIAGYPDGEFKGDRSMTRYEFAAIIYRALQNGAPVDGHMTRAVSEFAPELEKVKLAEYFRIDTVMTDGKGNPKIQRVRVSVNN